MHSKSKGSSRGLCKALHPSPVVESLNWELGTMLAHRASRLRPEARGPHGRTWKRGAQFEGRQMLFVRQGSRSGGADLAAPNHAQGGRQDLNADPQLQDDQASVSPVGKKSAINI